MLYYLQVLTKVEGSNKHVIAYMVLPLITTWI